MLSFFVLELQGCSVIADFDDTSTEDCANGLDDDLDGDVDCRDPDCDGAIDCNEQGVLCEDGRDNDLDGTIDVDDFGCWLLPRRLEVTRCESIESTETTDELLLDSGAWVGGPFASTDAGLQLLPGTTSSSGTLVFDLSGANYGRARGDRGTQVQVGGTLHDGWNRVTLTLLAGPTTPAGVLDPVRLDLSRQESGTRVWLQAGDEASPPDVVPWNTGRFAARLEFREPVLPDGACPVESCGKGTRSIVSFLSATGEAVTSTVYIEGRPDEGAPSLRAQIFAQGEPGSIELEAMSVTRPRRDTCNESLPYVALREWTEVHGLTGRQDTGVPLDLCLAGFAPASGRYGRVSVARGRIDGSIPINRRTAIPAWTDVHRVPGARFGVLGRGTAPERPFVLVTQIDGGSLRTLRYQSSSDCEDWSGSSRGLAPLGFPPESAAEIIPLGFAVDTVGDLDLLLVEGEPDEGPTRLISVCSLDVEDGTCAYERSVGFSSTAGRSFRLPWTTAVTTGPTWALLDGRVDRGALVLREQNGGLAETLGGGDRADALLDGSTTSGVFDRYLHQGALWLGPRAVFLREGIDVRPGWVVYTAGASRDDARGVGVATIRLVVESD